MVHYLRLPSHTVVLTTIIGDVVYLNVLGQSIVVLGSMQAARDLLDKRSSNYSDRPRSAMMEL